MEPSCKVEHVTSNFVESFNYWVYEVRFMSLVKLLDELRGKLAHTIWIRRTTTDRWTHPLTPKVSYRIRNL